ncbi:DUF309 domain-containing protein [bacterium]|nr:DUF309 domain-containing protein [bacterium]MBU1989903.1 DUF309 domain-containing protein [bacterium]
MTHERYTALLDEFILRIDQQRYYDAHESIEAIWFPRRFGDDNETKLLKGLINAAVCFELIKKGRYASSDKVWKNYLKYRPLLYKVHSPYLNKYHSIARHVENVKNVLARNRIMSRDMS